MSTVDGERSLWELSAVEMVIRLKSGQVTAVEAVQSALDRIRATSGSNAVVTLCQDRALAAAKRASSETVLAGLPVVVKDLTAVSGVRLTCGSHLLPNHVPDASDPLVDVIERNGGVVIGMTNTPEFGAGSNTFNEVFGATPTPFDTRRTAGGSSGGSAAALALGQCWLATGSDLGGSLRIPASFCGVVGFRPSPGLVAQSDLSVDDQLHGVNGPMARSVADLALFLDAMEASPAPPSPSPSATAAVGSAAGDDAPPAEGLAGGRGGQWLTAVSNPLTLPPPRRVLWSCDLGGTCPVEQQTREVCRAAVAVLEDIGSTLTLADADPAAQAKLHTLFTPAESTFRELRGCKFQGNPLFPVTDGPPGDKILDWLEESPVSAEWAAVVKPEIRWNVGVGVAQADGAHAKAAAAQEAMMAVTAEIFKECELLVCPCVVVPPFDSTLRYLNAIDEVKLPSYVEWLRATYAVTLTNCPALCLPVGFTADGELPIGLQLVGPPGGDAAVVLAAARLEAELAKRGFAQGVPRENTVGTSALSHAGAARVSGPTTAEQARAEHAADLAKTAA